MSGLCSLTDAPDMQGPVAGVDGCKGGWFVAMDAGDGDGIKTQCYPDLETLVDEDELKGYSLLVDIPMGLTPSAPRRLDAEMRRLSLNPSSVFPVPCREAVYAETYEAANARNHMRYGRKISKQAFGICPKIREMDELLRGKPELVGRVFESHPELCFQLIANERLPKKKNTEGFLRRIMSLENEHERLADICSVVVNALERFPRGQVAEDDILDALVLLLTARGPNRWLRCEEDRDPCLPGLKIGVVLPQQAGKGRFTNCPCVDCCFALWGGFKRFARRAWNACARFLRFGA